ncbi:MAG: nucleotide-binding protein, partial [Deltaproteobacteria bacterium]|nr:nucleotide-binding protein [Deltaproteobacteria bacterium]
GSVSAAHAGGHKLEKVAAKVEKAKGGHTVVEIFTKRKELANKKIILRGKVTKFNAGIMKRNWLHIQDGTGAVADKTFDLTVTTQASAKVGDIVTVEGVLAVDKDFGAGYAYSVIVEKATIKK